MKKQIMFVFIVAAFVFGAFRLYAAAPTSAVQHTPGEINYQGLLVRTDGTPVTDGTYTLEIRLYRVASGANAPIWGGKYSTYAKSGYFNIILGGSGGSVVSGTPQPTYAHNELWRALWPDPDISTQQKNSLFLEVKPISGVAGQLAYDTAIAPRQNLLAAPYAFRAQTAEYANQSFGDFKVNGAFEAGYGDGSSSAALKTSWTTIAGQVFRNIDIGGSTMGNVRLHGSGTVIDTGTLSVTSATQSFKSGTGGITLDSDTGNVNIKGNNATINMNGSVSVSGAGTLGTTIGSPSRPLNLKGSPVRGSGEFRWSTVANANTYERPFIVQEVTFTVPSNANVFYKDLVYKANQYSAMVVGWQAGSSVKPIALRPVFTSANGNWQLIVKQDSIALPTAYTVTIMFINKNLTSDSRDVFQEV